MASNIRDFEISLGRAADAVEDLVARRHRAVTLEAFTSVVRMSPVDSGLFRGNWQVSDGAPPSAPTAATDKSGAQTIALGSREIAKVRPYGRTWIANLLDYAQCLEDGHSQQAPAGMVAVTIARLRALFP
jgi:hypothetical protein